MARFGMTRKQFKTLEKKNNDRSFALPFNLPGTDEGRFTTEASKELVKLAEKIEDYRRVRNSIVHETASRRGSNASRLLGYRLEEAQQVPYTPRTFDTSNEGLAALADRSKSLAEIKDAELRNALAQLKEWYGLFVKAASFVFEFEYWKRIGK
jgi:hypothetical protein